MSPLSGVPAPLPPLTLTHIQTWDVGHLETAAHHWQSAADRWRDGFTAVNSGVARPAGTAWEGPAADAAALRTDRDRVQVLGLVDRLHEASTIARTGAADLRTAQSRVLTTVDNARRAGFAVAEDLSVHDTLTIASKPMRLIRDMQAQVFAVDIQAQSMTLAATDQSVAARLNTVAAGFTGFRFS
ncbi:MAG TPA: hypothetical protein VFK56_02405 [Mycobacterium sp.]|nr:hypothetical protein [Mycobacterium sp.]